ncbi:arylamine N-acetyltransferase [Streptomyces sp. CAI 127]|uniref:arylamine N-acetyltransferase family protein n=1 Tax=Streptomyces sp. CAI 127 TaxID=1076397 RepID=UPI0015877BA7|nr:arylamine N-acetyltransferase [Streptomyces sp. CAI 127]NUW03771.1 arylamine N-acetyltransferase [Streptomyces sp. CAI 127]
MTGPDAGSPAWRLPTAEYLRRIGHTGPVEPDADCLRALTTAHLRSVPYEMLDALDGRPPALDLPGVFAKVVGGRAGSTCLEATPLFGRFLRDAGFRVDLVPAQAWRVNGQWAPRWDHLLLLVEAEGVRWVVDVSFLMLTVLEPLPADGREHTRSGWTYRVGTADGYPAVLRRSGPDGSWVPVYRYDERPLGTGTEGYAWIVGYHMTADDSPLTGSLLCSRVVPDGKLILMRDNFVRAENGREHIEFLANAAEAEKAITEIFQDHDHLVEWAVNTWERTRKSRRNPLPGIG